MSLTNVEKTITLDVYDHDTTPSVIKAIQMDKGTRTVYAGIQNSRQDYDIGQNASVSLTVLRPDKTRVQIIGETFVSHTGTDGAAYGAKAYLSDVALAVKGNLKAQFKITSGEQELRTEIFTINTGEALDAGDGDWAGDLDGHNLDEMAQDIEDTKAAVSEMETDVSDLKEGLNTIETSDYTSAYESGSIALNVGVGNAVNPTPNTSANYKYQIIPCSVGDTFVIAGTGGDAPRLWGFTDENYKLLTVAGPNYTETSRTLTASEKGYFISNVNKNSSSYALTATIAKSRIDDLDADVYALQNSVENLDSSVIGMKKGLVSNAVKYGNPIDVSGASFFKNAKCSGLNSDHSPIIVSDVSFLITMPIPSDVGRIWIKKFTQAGQMILLYTVGSKGVNYTKSSNPDTNLIYNGNNYVVLDCAAAITAGYTTMLLSFDSEEDSGIYEYTGIFTVKDTLDYVTPLTGLNMFESVACLGDSYTQGFIVKSDSSAMIAHKPYPAVLHDRLGITVDNYGVGGTTSKTYITHVDGLPKVLAAPEHDLYMICFGINDSGQSMTIGTVADINDSDYTQNADTFCGNLGKMYQMLVEQFPNARFVFIGNWGVGLWYAAYSPYAKAMQKVAEHFNVPYVDPLDDPFFYSDIFKNDVGGHPTQPGYTGMAYAVERLMAKCIANNYEYYRYAGVEEP